MNTSRDQKKIMVEFGRHLQEIRLRKNLSLRDLEATSFVDYSTINKIENGKRNPSLTILVHLAEGLEIELSELINFKGKK